MAGDDLTLEEHRVIEHYLVTGNPPATARALRLKPDRVRRILRREEVECQLRIRQAQLRGELPQDGTGGEYIPTPDDVDHDDVVPDYMRREIEVTPEMIVAGLFREATFPGNLGSTRVAALDKLAKILGIEVDLMAVAVVDDPMSLLLTAFEQRKRARLNDGDVIEGELA